MIKGDYLTQTRFDLDDYSIRVLDVVKGKFGLKNRNEAIKKFIEEHGTSYVEPEVNEIAIKELDRIVARHKKKHPNKTMTVKELNELLGL